MKDPRPGKEDEDDDDYWTAPRCRVGRRPKAMHRHPNRALPLGPGHHTTRPPWPEAASLVHLARLCQAVESSCSNPHNMKCLAPNSWAVLRQQAEGHAGPTCPHGHPRCAAVGADQRACPIHTPCGPSDPGRTACLYLVAAASRRRCGRMSAVCGRHWWPLWRVRIDGKTPL